MATRIARAYGNRSFWMSKGGNDKEIYEFRFGAFILWTTYRADAHWEMHEVLIRTQNGGMIDVFDGFIQAERWNDNPNEENSHIIRYVSGSWEDELRIVYERMRRENHELPCV